MANIAYALINNVFAGFDVVKHQNFDAPKEGIDGIEIKNENMIKQKKKLNGVAKVIDKNAMPLSSYTIIHRDAILNDHQKTVFFSFLIYKIIFFIKFSVNCRK